MYVKFHKSKDSLVISICDENLIGKTFTEDDKQLAQYRDKFEEVLFTAVAKIIQASQTIEPIFVRAKDLLMASVRVAKSPLASNVNLWDKSPRDRPIASLITS